MTSPPTRPTYAQVWPAYNAAQESEIRLFDALLADLVETAPEIPYPGNGRPALPMRDQAFCAIQKVYSQLSSRRTATLYEYAAERGQVGHAPHFNVASKFLNRSDATILLRSLVHQSAAPLVSIENQFALDSTGFRTTSFGVYHGVKHGEQKEHRWLKVHLASGVRTHIIADVIVTDATGVGTGDTTQFPALVQGTAEAGFAIRELLADKAYASRVNHELAVSVGAQALIPFKALSKARAKGSEAWRKAFLYFQLHHGEFEKRYHQRSNVEATIGALKRKFGESIRSKNRVAQENELLCKAIAYNITILIQAMYEEGIDPVTFFGSLAQAHSAPRVQSR